MQKKKTQQGKRGPKLKPESEKKVKVQFYVKQASVDDKGGMEKCRELGIAAIES